MSLVIRADATMEILSGVDKLDSDKVRGIIGGAMNISRIAGGCALIVNSESGLQGLPVNIGATSLLGQCCSVGRVKGTAILLDSEDVERVILGAEWGKMIDPITRESILSDRPIVKVRHNDLETFLRSHGELWQVDGDQSWDAVAPGSPMSLDELMGAIQAHGADSECVYLFSDCDTPLALLERTNADDIPFAGADELPHYIIRRVKGGDFLWFACSAQEASNGTPLTLMHAKDEDHN